MMPAQTHLPNLSIEQLVERIFAFRQISPLDQQLLKSALLSKPNLSDAERRSIARVFKAVQQGHLVIIAP